MILIKHFPALQIIPLFFGALFSILSFQHVKLAKIIAIIAVLISLYLSIYGLSAQLPFVYYFGNWPAPIGIEYRIDYLNQSIIIYINCVILFCLTFGNELIDTTVLEFIDRKRQSLFYAILLFAHAGYVGMVSTNDLFNLYVFIEISSLSTYVLMAQGGNRDATVGAFDYLMLGTIGATLILIAIGLLLSYTGSLNMTDISNLLAANYNSKIILISISFFLVGTILKAAFFPMHFWMIRAYSSVAPVILTYIAGISTIIGIYIIFRFIHFTIDYNIIVNLLAKVIKPLALAAMILCAYFALIQEKIRNILIYSSASQIEYVFLLLAIPKGENIIFPFIFADSLNKIALLLIIAYRESYSLKNFKNLGMLWKALVSFSLICSAGLPITSMFIIKLTIFELLIIGNQWLEFMVIIISSCISFLYNYKIFKKLFFEQGDSYKKNIISSNLKYYGLFFITIMQILLLLYISRLQAFYSNIGG
ncbi:MAG: cation:proton antiporter [Rickettsia endosymbiont of Bryobia graminum]|nr:cation:proton antiporter [Rickettsia endosymbiont of Bryobia graminum]